DIEFSDNEGEENPQIKIVKALQRSKKRRFPRVSPGERSKTPERLRENQRSERQRERKRQTTTGMAEKNKGWNGKEQEAQSAPIGSPKAQYQ
ncbi:MAG: hypothetical protein ACKPKO_00950, partial [Candidatus Fonsibacter sp.]